MPACIHGSVMMMNVVCHSFYKLRSLLEMSDNLTITPLMMLGIVHTFPAEKQAVFRSAGTLGAGVFEDLVARREVERYVTDARLDKRFPNVPVNIEDEDVYSLETVALNVEAMFEDRTGDGGMMALIMDVCDQVKWVGSLLQERLAHRRTFRQALTDHRRNLTGASSDAVHTTAQLGRDVYARAFAALSYDPVYGFDDPSSLGTHFVRSRHSSDLASASSASDSDFSHPTITNPQDVIAAWKRVFNIMCLRTDRSWRTSGRRRRVEAPMDPRGDDQLIPVVDFARAVNNALTGPSVTQAVAEVTAFPSAAVSTVKDVAKTAIGRLAGRIMGPWKR